MSKSVLESISNLLQPDLPMWACEITSRHVIVAGVDSRRTRITGKAAVDARAAGVTGSLSGKNVGDEGAALSVIRDGISQAGLKGSEIGVVIPDDAARIALLSAEALPSGQEERETFVRWKLKKSLPFDLDSAQVAFKVISPHELLVAMSPRAVIDEYVGLLDKAGLHAGFVTPSTLAVLNLLQVPEEDAIVVKIAPGCITTTVFQNRSVKFYRRVAEGPLYDAVYPTVLYYQDKLMGAGIGRIVVCAYDGDQSAVAELQQKLELPVYKIEPGNVDDAFKPSLGAVGLVWSNLI